MFPPVDIILRRRHLVLVLMRAAAAAIALYGLIRAAQALVLGTAAVAAGGRLAGYAIDVIAPVLGIVAPALVLGLCAARLARWIVPAGMRADVCLNCAYPIKNLHSPICPECGADVGR